MWFLDGWIAENRAALGVFFLADDETLFHFSHLSNTLDGLKF